jgi:hypothetical protein
MASFRGEKLYVHVTAAGSETRAYGFKNKRACDTRQPRPQEQQLTHAGERPWDRPRRLGGLGRTMRPGQPLDRPTAALRAGTLRPLRLMLPAARLHTKLKGEWQVKYQLRANINRLDSATYVWANGGVCGWVRGCGKRCREIGQWRNAEHGQEWLCQEKSKNTGRIALRRRAGLSHDGLL